MKTNSCPLFYFYWYYGIYFISKYLTHRPTVGSLHENTYLAETSRSSCIEYFQLDSFYLEVFFFLKKNYKDKFLAFRYL